MLSDEEIETILKDIFELHGYDFSYYAKDSFKRRINRLFKFETFKTFAEFRDRIRSDPGYINHFIDRITVNVTEMFRDPNFFKDLRSRILPVLAAKPYIKIWHAGCSTGEEVYSTAILLHEAGLLEKSLLYATDINPHVLEKARTGIFPVSLMQLYSKNYVLAGGEKEFSSYFVTTPQGEKFNNRFRSRMIFSTHNLASGGYFNEFDLIICRNVLIYFDKDLQNKALTLFDTSMANSSFLALGEKETIKFSVINSKFKQIGNERIWQKVK